MVKADESFTMTGHRFTALTGDQAGSDTTVWVLVTSLEKAALVQATVWLVTDNLLTATLPKDIPPGVVFVWVENDLGVSTPITLNRATADWIGPLGNEAAPGSRKRVFGKSLSKDHGETESHVFVRPDGSADFIALTVTAVEPYAVEFEVPTQLGEGGYELFVHNGHGGIYGFSNPIPLIVKKPWARSSIETTLPPSGLDDSVALQQALNKAGALPEGGTVRLNPGSYTISQTITIPAKVKLQGAGKANTIVDSKLQRSTRFVALKDQEVNPPRWAAAFAKWVTPTAKLDEPLTIDAEPAIVSYSYRFKKEQTGWFFRPIVALDGPEKTSLLLWVNQNGNILVRRNSPDGEIIAETRIDPLPLDTYVDIQWKITQNRIVATIRGDQVLDAEVNLASFPQMNSIRLLGVAHESIASELPVHFIADLKVQKGNKIAFADDFSNNDVSPKWDGVQDPIVAFQAGGDHVEIEGITLRSPRRHLGLNDHNHLRIADVALVDSTYGTASGAVTFYGTHVEIADSHVGVIDPIDQHASADYWFHGNLIIGEVLPDLGFNHAGVYPNGKRGVIERNHFQNNWPEGKMTGSDNFIADLKTLQPTPWLSRLLLVGGRSGRPRMYHHYVGHNTAKGIAWQGNYGELILLHSLRHGWFGPVVKSEGLTLQLGLDGVIDGAVRSMVRRGAKTGGKLSADTGEDGDHVMIIEGKGFGQIRRVMAHGEDTITIDHPWRVEPDASSLIAIAPMSGNNIIYKNDMEAFKEGYVLSQHSASTGVSLYGNTFANFVEGNRSSGTRSGRTISGEANRPSWWNEMRDEVAERVQGGHGLSFLLREDAFSPTALGNTFKNIRVGDSCDAVISTMSWFLKPTSRPEAMPKVAVGNLFENIDGKASGSGIVEKDDGKYGAAEAVHIYDNLYRNNRFVLSGNEPAVSLLEKSRAMMSNNQFPDFSGEMLSVKGGGDFQPPVQPLHRAIRVQQGQPIQLPLANIGTDQQTWELRSDSPWIVIDTAQGALMPQASGAVTVTINSAKLTPGTKRGVITLISSGQSIPIGVYPR